MPSSKNKRSTKISRKPENRLRRLKTELNRSNKKMKKLLSRSEGKMAKSRWKMDEGSKVQKTQGILSGSKRHVALQEHIKSLEKRIKNYQR